MSKQYKVTNRSSSLVFYSIPEKNIHRQFTVGETKMIDHDELTALSYQSGGPGLIRNYLYIADADAAAEFNGTIEPEYHLDTEGVKKLILDGSIEEFLDCLDFAPEGVIEMIKTYAVELPMTDSRKAAALKEKTGFDAFVAIKNNNDSKEDNDEELKVAKERRVKADTPAQSGRRTVATESKYKVISE